MSTLEILLLSICIMLFVIMVAFGCYLSIIADKLQAIGRIIYWLRDEDDE